MSVEGNLNQTKKWESRKHYLILFFFFLYFCSTYIFTVYSWGRYIYLFSIVMMLCINISHNGFKLKLYGGDYLNWLSAFSLLCLSSAIWAWDSSCSFGRAKTVITISICSYFIFVCVKDELTLEDILNAIMLAGYVEAIYLFVSFGAVDLLTGGSRLSNELGNANYVSFLMSVSIIITADSVLNKRARIYHLLALSSLGILAVGQSRAALIGAVFGFFVLLFCKSFRSGNILKVITNIFMYLSLGLLIVFIMSKIPLFEGVLARMRNLVVAFTGRGAITDGERSVTTRQLMIKVGLDCFKQHPILGIGIGNSSLIVKNALGRGTYLHNNFVEILATLGIIGFCIYYSIYFISFISLLKYKNYRNKEYDVILALLLMTLLMDYGAVSYYEKDTFMYFMLFVLETNELKTNSTNRAL